MNYPESLKFFSNKYNSIVCMGMDPVLEKIPLNEKNTSDKIFIFYESILNKMVSRNIFPASVKPNYAFYAQYGFDGIFALKKLIDLYKSQNIPVILDVKRGDIGTTATAYAKECFDFFNADSVTLSPYMGFDSISPFSNKYPNKGYYILCKTSNQSSIDFQDIKIDGKELYLHVASKIISWYSPGISAVVGATYTDQLNKICEIFSSSGKEIPLLIPGIGTQGGDLEKTISILKSYGNCSIHRINSSSGINYAYLSSKEGNFSDAAVNALDELNNQINSLLS